MEREKNTKLIVFIVAIILIIVIGLGYFFITKQKEERNKKYSPDVKLTNEFNYKNLKVTDIASYKYEDNYHVTFNITNKGKESFKSESVNVTFKNVDKKVVYKTTVVIPDLEKDELSSMDIITDNKTIDAVKMEITKIKK